MPADAAPQPRSSEKPDEPALVTAMFSRRLAEPFARLCVRLGIPANAVTIAGGACWLVSLALPPLAGFAMPKEAAGGLGPAAWLWLAAAALWCLGYFLDVVDGSVARLTGTGTTAGFFLDYVFHVLFKPAFLFSVGLGLEPLWLFLALPGPVGLLVFLVLLFSIPANGSQASHATELALRAECAAGRLRPGEGPAALWLGSDAVAAPASAKRGTPLRTAATLVREVSSYYLQAPLFAFAVALDAIPLLVRGRPLVPLGPMPCTLLLWFALGALLAIRIPLRCARERRRLGLAPCEPPPPAAAPRPHGPPYPFGRPAASAPSRLRRAARLFFLRLAWEPLLYLLAWTFFLSLAISDTILFPDWPVALLLAHLPFSAVLLAPAEEVAAAHVFCQTAGKGGAPDPAGAPWRWPLVVPAACLLLLCFVAAAAVSALWLYGASPAVDAAIDCIHVVMLVFGLPAVLLSQLILLPWRLARVYRRLRAARGA